MLLIPDNNLTSLKSNQRGNVTIIVVIILIILFLGGIFYWKQQNKIVSNDQNFSQANIATFAECLKSTGSQVIDTYPKLCKTADKVTFIEEVKEPVDTSNWTTFNEISGFTFQCPPSWNCKKFKEDSATIGQNHYLDISGFNLFQITPENFQQSFIRHPSYNTPVAWLNGIKAKDPNALKALPSTIKPVPGTDALDYTLYHNLDVNDVVNINSASGSGVIIPAKDGSPDTLVVIPLNSKDVALVLLDPGYLYKNPIINSILTSIKPKN